ncbi:MAG: 5-methylcytosine-specific restriction enzyme B [Deltaproteobacteria bacterium ADurb.Bin135]|nr:MAG: 5-methylcytosine-specific restriction enzyme B [Deltaproteobacteria bacterium ADurb.Bin135]
MEINYNEKTRMVKPIRSGRDIFDYFEMAGFFFPKETLTRYFLSLRTKPFVILTGISGTGKTKIAQIFAEYICQDDTPEKRSKRIAFVSVRPDWMDNRGLLGYYNLLDEKYHTTVVTEVLLEATQNPDKPYFIILDEMNLAKVEQYFSDFLSIMESRTPSNPNGEPIRLHHAEEVDAHNGLKIPGKLNIPPNVFFTGTVNVDESTYMFSPKVLDRANVIEFNDVNIASYSKGYSESGEFVLKESHIIKKLMPSGSEKPFCSRADYDKAGEYVDNFFKVLLDVLSPYNLHFGYRVINEISRFVTNAKEEIEDFNIDDVLDIQMLQKILPKFHGSQAKLLEPLGSLFEACAKPGYTVDASQADDPVYMTDREKFRYPRSANKLSRMLRNLKIQGYTSFIE